MPAHASHTPTFLFAGGGSGGHIYPGLAIAEQLLALAPASDPPRILFLVSDRAIDRQVLEKFPYPFEISPAKPLSVRPRGLIRFLANWGKSVRLARGIIREHTTHGPVHLVAMGGFVAAPAVQAARVERVPITMVNLDAVPGKANRWMARRLRPTDHIFTAARLAPHCTHTHWQEVPPIVRAGSRANIAQTEARTRLGLSADRPVLMITGGSQGIRTINTFALAFAESPDGGRLLRDGGWQIIHQTGKGDDARIAEAYKGAGVRVLREGGGDSTGLIGVVDPTSATAQGTATTPTAVVQPFVDHMNLWYAAADLVLGTAGAGNVAEVWANTTPALLMPYPYHKDQHQKFNALALEQCGGVVVARDHIEPAENLGHVGPLLTTLMTDPVRLKAMRTALQTLGPADGAQRIAAALLASGAQTRGSR